jgi:hypothetical protein
MKIGRSFLLMLVLLAGPAYGHQDRILALEKDGSIADIPPSFGKATLVVDGLGTAAVTVTLSIGSHTTTLPACMTRLIRTTGRGDIKLSGSWYHDETRLPYYLNVTFLDPGSSAARAYNSSQSFLFNLHNARLMRQERFDADRSGEGGQISETRAPENCEAVSAIR